MKLPVVWAGVESAADMPRGSWWDQAIVDRMVGHVDWDTGDGRAPDHLARSQLAYNDGAVWVLAGRYFAADPQRVARWIADRPWNLVVLASDEEGDFSGDVLARDDRTALWRQTPHDNNADRFLPLGAPPHVAPTLRDLGHLGRDRDWFFSGQITHPRRQAAAAAMRSMGGGEFVPTDGFTASPWPDRATYVERLARSCVVPCPGGPTTPDTFRLWEALEAGCAPIVDARAAYRDTPGFWDRVAPGAPWPLVEDWGDLPALTAASLAAWPRPALAAGSWWQQHKRTMAWWLTDDLDRLGAPSPAVAEPDQMVTVLIPTSPTPGHPSMADLRAVVESVRVQLPAAEILILADGVHHAQEHRRAAYEAYLERVWWACEHEWVNVVPVWHDDHRHQVGLARHAVDHLVRTPLVLFVEHDTPLDGPIDWAALCAAVGSGEANVVRFHHEASVLDVHRHLMLGDGPHTVAGAPLWRTVQWSQRPHLASTRFYQRLLARFEDTSRTMIEDAVYGWLIDCWHQRGEAGWDEWRVWLYCPSGNIKRSAHLDSRGDDPKVEMTWTWRDGEGVPAP